MIKYAVPLASVLIVVIGLVHSALGEFKLIGPLLAPQTRCGILERSAFARNVLRFAWHLTTLAWWGLAGAALAAYLPDNQINARAALGVIAVTFALTGFIILFAGRGRHWAWPVFLAIAALLLIPAMF